MPIVGRLPGCSNGYIAVGHGAVGIQLSPVTGLAIAELITSGECTSCDLACFDLMRFAETVRRTAQSWWELRDAGSHQVGGCQQEQESEGKILTRLVDTFDSEPALPKL